MVDNYNITEPKNAKKKEGRLEEKGSILKMLRVSKCKWSLIPTTGRLQEQSLWSLFLPRHTFTHSSTLLHTLIHSSHSKTLFTLLHTFTHSYTFFHTLPPPTLHFPYPSYHRVKPPLHVKVDEHCMQNHTKQHLHFYTLLINTTTKKNTGSGTQVCLSAFP